MHPFADQHDTASTVRAFGSFCSVHELPFQRSATVTPPPLSWPTASHPFADQHDTPLSSLLRGLAAFSRVHVLPFQLSASVVPLKLLLSPTAMHPLADQHETPKSKAWPPRGFGVS